MDNRQFFQKLFHDNLKWKLLTSVRFRWLVALLLIVLPYILGLLGKEASYMPLILVVAVMCIYNGLLYLLLKRDYEKARSEKYWKTIARSQIVLDYLALTFVLYYLGGFQSHLTSFYLFHLIVGATILPARDMYILAVVSAGVYLGVSAAEFNHWIIGRNLLFEPVKLSFQSIAIQSVGILTVFLGAVIFVSKIINSRARIDLELFDANRRLSVSKERIEESLKSIQRIEQRKSKFMLYSAHQLRSPLGTIISVLEVLKRRHLVALDSERAYQLILGALHRAESLLDIVNGLLVLAKLRDTEKKKEVNEEIDLVSALLSIVRSLSPKIEEKGICFLFEVQLLGGTGLCEQNIHQAKEEVAGVIGKSIGRILVPTWGKKEFRDAFYNIIENAIKYTPGGEDKEVKIVVEELPRPQWAKITVIDQGIGIDQENLEDIFFEFMRASNAKEFESEGTGLGLAIAKEILDSHGTSVKIHSKLKVGTSFVIEV